MSKKRTVVVFTVEVEVDSDTVVRESFDDVDELKAVIGDFKAKHIKRVKVGPSRLKL